MYNVSDEYMLAVANSRRKSKMRAVLTLGSTVINLDDNDIIKDSVYVTNQCTNGNEYEYGCVYSAECGITIKSAVDRYALYNAELKLFWSLWTGAAWEEIPLGVFYVSEPNRINDKISLKALDGMTRLDVNVDEDTIGTMPQLVAYIAEKCGVELAQSEEELATFVNAEYQLSLYEENIETYRDALAYICMLTACFATFDREGKLKLVQYATEPCVELGRKQRFANATFSDYTTAFSGVACRFIADENYAPYEAGNGTAGLVLDMGDIPILRGLPETKHAVLDNVYNVLKNVSYTPFELSTMGNPALDLGDYIKNVGVGKDNNTYISPITYSYWTYRGKHKLRAVGGNPRLAGVKSREDRHISSLEGEINAKIVMIKEYRNSDAITFSSKAAEIAHINYAATENSKPIMLLSVRLTTDLDGVLVLQFYTDGAIDTARTYRKYLERGEHFVTVADTYTAENNDRHTITVLANMEYFESDTRKQAADVQTGKNFLAAIAETGATVTDNVVAFPTYNVAEIDTTVASASIKKGESIAILYGQGIAGEGKWDGTINFNAEIDTIPFGNMFGFTGGVNEVLSVNTQTPTPIVFSAEIGSVPFSGQLNFALGIKQQIQFGEIIKDYTFNAMYANNYVYDRYITTNNDMFSLKSIYTYASTEETIDSGKMCSVAMDYTGIQVESVVVSNG